MTTQEILDTARRDLAVLEAAAPDARLAPTQSEFDRRSERRSLLNQFAGSLHAQASMLGMADHRLAEAEAHVAKLNRVEAALQWTLKNNPKALARCVELLHNGWTGEMPAVMHAALGVEGLDHRSPSLAPYQGREVAVLNPITGKPTGETRHEPGILERARAERDVHAAKIEADARSLAAMVDVKESAAA